ncbi:MAG: transcription termination factor NusA [bacterium]|nr:transcription termination factor NusA [bacterium]
MSSPISQAIDQICEEKNIPKESVIKTIEAALAVAYRKDFGEKDQNIVVEFDPETAISRVFDVKTVVDISDEEIERQEEERQARREARESEHTEGKKAAEKIEDKKADAETDEEEDVLIYDPRSMITLKAAQEKNKEAKFGDEIRAELFPPAAYGRMAAQTAKQVIIQRLREAERETIFERYKEKEGQIINGTIQRIEGRLIFVDLGDATAIMPPSEQVDSENYHIGLRLKFFLVTINQASKGPEIVVSRSHPEVVKKLFEFEVPEIASGAVEIKAVAREAGSRAKIAVASSEPNIDPVGSCVGQRGTRVQTVISELGGEKIDIVEHEDDPVKFIINALAPAKVLSVMIKEEEKAALAEVKEDQLSLAIGRGGQNVRLAAKLTGWRIDVVKEGEPEPARRKPQKAKDEKAEAKEEEQTGVDVDSDGKKEQKAEIEVKEDSQPKENDSDQEEPKIEDAAEKKPDAS